VVDEKLTEVSGCSPLCGVWCLLVMLIMVKHLIEKPLPVDEGY
jgi:hypothetical protein